MNKLTAIPATPAAATRRSFLIGGGSAAVLMGLAACGSSSGNAASSSSSSSSPSGSLPASAGSSAPSSSASSPSMASSALSSTGSTGSTGSTDAADAAPSGSRGPTSAVAPGGTYTDARGQKVAIPAAGGVVVAQSSAAAALWDAGFQVKGAYGELKTTGGKLDYQAGSLDLAKLTVVGTTYGEFAVEKYAALNPKLLIDLSFDDKTLWYVPANSAAQIGAIAPTLGVKMLGLQLPAIIEEFVGLAQQLGADPGTAVKAKVDFDAAAAAVKSAGSAKAGIKVLVVSRNVDKVYVADPKMGPDLAHWASLGVSMVGPSVQLKETDYFQELSWEQIGTFKADVILYDAREVAGAAAAAAKISTWAAMPAVKAGQVYPWYAAAPYSYKASAPLYNDFAKQLSGAKKVT